ncbi:hypothetical protein ABZ595_37665 [Streptomyces rubradiris]|jgi:hypothetical protein
MDGHQIASGKTTIINILQDENALIEIESGELLTYLHTEQVRIVNPRDERYKGRATERKHYIVSFFVQFADQKLIKEIEVLAMEENHARNLVQERFKGLGISVNIAKLRSIIN